VQNLIRDRQVVAVIGSGVSRATNANAPSWRGLIESAIERCSTLGAEDGWCKMVRDMLAMERAPDMLLGAAELVDQRLREHGELGRWLSDIFNHFAPKIPPWSGCSSGWCVSASRW
jgi:hypothetical protein